MRYYWNFNDLSQRTDEPEWMDTFTLSRHQLEKVLTFLRVTNRYFGGTFTILNTLKTWSKRWQKGEAIRILDIGTGEGDIPRALVDWGRKEGVFLHITGIDLVPEIIDIAKVKSLLYPEISFKTEDVRNFSPLEKQFDYVIGSLLLHHINSTEHMSFLRAIDNLSVRGVILSDLQRSFLSYFSISALCAVIGNHIVRHDGPLSVRRGFRIEELNKLIKKSGLSYLEAIKEPWFRLSLKGEKI